MIAAKTYDNSMEEPLLEQPPKTGEAQEEEENQHSKVKTSSLLLGLMVGFFIQFSTLGANYLAITLWGEDVMNTSKADIILFSLLWSFFTSSMAIVILAFLRNLIEASYTGDDFDNVILHLECRFVVGALIGVCSAWAATDYVLGMSQQIVYSVATLVVALLWCRVMLWIFTPVVERQREGQQREVPEVLMVV